MKKIAYVIRDSGIDGRSAYKTVKAFWNESERDKAYESDPNKNYYRKAEVIVDLKSHSETILRKLDGLDKLVLGLSDSAVFCCECESELECPTCSRLQNTVK